MHRQAAEAAAQTAAAQAEVARRLAAERAAAKAEEERQLVARYEAAARAAAKKEEEEALAALRLQQEVEKRKAEAEACASSQGLVTQELEVDWGVGDDEAQSARSAMLEQEEERSRAGEEEVKQEMATAQVERLPTLCRQWCVCLRRVVRAGYTQARRRRRPSPRS